MKEIIERIKHPSVRKWLIAALIITIVSFTVGGIVGYYRAEKNKKRNERIEHPSQNPYPFGVVTSGLKGVDLSGLDEEQETRVVNLLNVVLCLASNERMSVARCRRDVPHCVTSQRMADYIVDGVIKGLEDEVILTRLYGKAFKEGGAMANLENEKVYLLHENLPSLGPPDAPVAVTLFYDYTSGFSHQAWEKVIAMYHLYPKRVRVVFWPCPRSRLDPKAEKAARVALAAHRLGKFDVIHPLLMESKGEIEDGKLDGFTEEAGLEPESLNQEAISPEVRSRVKTLQSRCLKLGIGCYPAIFVAGRRITGAIPETCMLVGAVQQALAETVTEEYEQLASRIAPH